MTVDISASPTTGLLPGLPRPAPWAPPAPTCETGRELGQRCLPPLPSTGGRYCAMHDPEGADQRRERASHAARRSHAARLRPLDLGLSDEDVDLETTDGRQRIRAALFRARKGGRLDDKPAATLIALLEGAAREASSSRGRQPAAPAAPLLVDLGLNGPAPAEATP